MVALNKQNPQPFCGCKSNTFFSIYQMFLKNFFKTLKNQNLNERQNPPVLRVQR